MNSLDRDIERAIKRVPREALCEAFLFVVEFKNRVSRLETESAVPEEDQEDLSWGCCE